MTSVAAFGSVLAITAAAYAVAPGSRAPTIGLTSTSGARIDAASLRGQVFIVDFWASWCAPCRQELPMLEALYVAERARGFTVIGVGQDSAIGPLTSFLARTPVSFPIVHDAAHAVARRYAPTTMPTTFVVDRLGVVRYVHAGYTASTGPLIAAEARGLL